VVERGKLVVKKPGRLRMTYTRPKKEFVSNGTTFFAHFIEDKYGTETPLPKAGDASLALLFLAGRGSLVTDFTATLPATQPEGMWQVVLTPKAPQADFDTLTLTVERGSMKLATLVTEDADAGTSTFEFSGLRENTGVADSTFAFSFPKGTIRR
jgi:outer membrane lipoprotein-sorting protein